MSEARVKLASLTGDELASDVDTIVKDSVLTGEQPGVTKGGGDVPHLTEAVRALLIMCGCDANYAGNHWVVRKTKISKEEEDAWARATMENRRRIRFQTGVPLNGTFEDWRAALDGLVGGLPKP